VSAQPWVCSSCRSVNQPREKRCYSCRTPRDLVEADPKTLLVAGAGSTPSGQPKPVGTFRSSGDLAFLTQVLIVAALAVSVVGLVLGTDVVGRLEGLEESDASLSLVALVGGLGVIVAGAALVAFALWLSRVVANVPAIGLGWPNVTPSSAIFESIIPGVNLYRVPAILRDVVNRLEPAGPGDALIAATWLGLVGGVLLPRAANLALVFLIGSTDDFAQLLILVRQVALGLTVGGGIMLIALIQWVETRMERRAAEQPATSAPAVRST
jgi:hypothetical protein